MCCMAQHGIGKASNELAYKLGSEGEHIVPVLVVTMRFGMFRYGAHCGYIRNYTLGTLDGC